MSIRIKILAGLIAVFGIIFAAANFIMVRSYTSDAESAVRRDLATINSTCQFYTTQNLLINNDPINSDSFSSEADSIVDDLGKSQNIYFAAYTLNGRFITSNGETVFRHQQGSDLALAIKGKSGYYIKTTGSKTIVTYSFPVVVSGQKIGILRCINDYSSIYLENEKNLQLINLIILGGFLLCLVFGVVFSGSVISPVSRLSHNLKKASDDIKNNSLDPKKVSERLSVTRRDEIGDLTRSIVDLSDKISQQMEVINKDREELSRLSEYRRDFYNVVTHELKTPLTSIKGYAEVAKDNGFSDRDFFDMAMSRIIEESDRLHEMVVGLLEGSSLNKAVDMPLDRVELSQIASSVCESMRYKAEKYAREIRFSSLGSCWVLGNPQRLRELVINLLDNAIKYASDPSIELCVREDGSRILLEVVNSVRFTSLQDGGLVLPASDPVNREKGSVGLGLGICRQIVDKHNGSIKFAMRDGGKLSVTVSLPVYRGL
jgi:signal transduction histidine kinase